MKFDLKTVTGFVLAGLVVTGFVPIPVVSTIVETAYVAEVAMGIGAWLLLKN